MSDGTSGVKAATAAVQFDAPYLLFLGDVAERRGSA